jgi:hypothetical protein
LEEIRQERPSRTSWTIWRRFLGTICKDVEEKISTTNINENDKEEDHKYKFSKGTNITKYWNGVPYIGTIIDNTGKNYKI